MKTPREFLLARHQHAVPRLDEIRRAMVEKRRPLTQKLWEELILPVRRVWVGIGVAWMMVIALNVLTGADPQVNFNIPGAIAPESVIALQRNEELMAQANATDTQPAKPPESRPRSEVRIREKIV